MYRSEETSQVMRIWGTGRKDDKGSDSDKNKRLPLQERLLRASDLSLTTAVSQGRAAEAGKALRL